MLCEATNSELEPGGTGSGGGWTLSGLDDDDAERLAFLSQITTFAPPSCHLSSLNPINNSRCLRSLFTRAIFADRSTAHPASA